MKTSHLYQKYPVTERQRLMLVDILERELIEIGPLHTNAREYAKQLLILLERFSGHQED
jgi:hypothetical protein